MNRMNLTTARFTPRRTAFFVAGLAILLTLSLALTTVGTTPAQAGQGKKEAKKKHKAWKKMKRKKRKKRRQTVSVMSRNLYLGADLGPAIRSTGPADFIEKNGQILRDVDTNNFAVRARGLAREIRGKSPDLVGLQEAALWRTGPASLAPSVSGDYTASHVHVDYIRELMKRLNHGKKRYRVVKVQPEFDFEAPADYDNDPSTGAATFGGEINGRLTMRDAILARVGAGVKVRSTAAGHYKTLYRPVVSGIPINVERGWLSANVKVRKAPRFRFVDTHLESFGDTAIREAQAKELVGPGGPVTTKRQPTILVGDLNSDDNTVEGGDRLAFDALKRAGLRDRSTEKVMSCCLKTDILTDNYGNIADFDHHIDHVMTNKPRRVKKLASSVTGRKPHNGYWDSDHAGMFSKLRIRR